MFFFFFFFFFFFNKGFYFTLLVTSINRGRDGLVRSMNLRTANGTINRPLTRLHPLEVQAKEVQCHTEDETTTAETPTSARRPQRDAARRAIRKIADCAKDICVAPEDVKYFKQ